MSKVFQALQTALIFALSLACSQSFAATYYVSMTGSDANDGLSAASPFRTIARAATAVGGGDTVEIEAGTYTEDINIDGIQPSTQAVRFVGPSAPAAQVIISEATLSIFNSNYLEFENLQFQGSKRFLVVSGSYENVFTSCQFTSGSEPLLIKDGKVALETCTLTDFAGDGLRVDGEALVVVNNSTISGCHAEGIEISATAKVVLNGTTISNNTGDGIKVDDSQGSIDPGDLGGGGGGGSQVGLITGLDGINATGGRFISFDSAAGGNAGSGGGSNASGMADLYSNGTINATTAVVVDGSLYLGPSGSTNITHQTGTINTAETDYVLAPIDAGNVRTVNDNASIPLTSKGNNAIDGTGRLVLVGNKQGGDLVDVPPGTYYFTGISVSGESMVRFSGPTTIYVEGPVDLTGGYFVNLTQKAENLKIFGLSSDLMNLSAFDSLFAAIYAPDATVGYYATTAKGNVADPLGIRGMVVAKRIELSAAGGIRADLALIDYANSLTGSSSGGSPSSSAPPSGWQPIATVELDITGGTVTSNRRAAYLVSPATFNAQNAQFTNSTEWGLCLNGPFDLDTCTISDNGIGGVWLKGVNDGEFNFTKLTIGNNPQYGMYLEDCDVNFDGIILDQYTFTSSSDCILAVQGGSLTLDGVTITGGTVAGVYATAGTLTVRNSTVSGSGYGIGADQSTVDIENCTLTGNATGLYGYRNATLTVTGTTLSNNTSWGAAVSLNSTVGATTTFSGSTLSGNGAGFALVDAVSGTIELPNTVIENNTNDGIRAENCTLTLNASASPGLQITNNNYGINSVNSTLSLDGLTLSGNSAAAVYAVGGNLSVSNSTLSSGGYGVSVSNSGTVSIDTCNLSGTTAGLNADQNADVTVTSSNFTGSPHGLWATNNTQLDVDSSTFSGNSSYGVYLAGNGSVHNCTITGNASGLYLNTCNVTDATLTGTDITGNSTYGVYVYNGSLALSSQVAEDWSIDSNGYNIASYQANLSLTGVNMTNATNYGVHAEYGSLNLQQSTISSNLDGVWGSNTTAFTVDRSHISGTNAGGWGVASLDGELVMRNTVVSGAASGVYSSGPSKPATIYNSTIADASLYGIYVENGDATVMNTIISGTSGTSGLYRGSTALVTHSHNLVSGFAAPFENTTADATELLKLPRFVDAANGDFSLAKGSPAINAGADLSLSHTVDMLGNTRPSHKVFEIGAYEYMPDGGSLRVLNWKESQ